jgi:hypothetical protein
MNAAKVIVFCSKLINIVVKMGIIVMNIKIIGVGLAVWLYLFAGVAIGGSNDVIKDDSIKNEIRLTIGKTIELLKSLDSCDKYGDIGWGSSLTIGSAVGKLKKSLNDIKNVNLEKVKEYSRKVTNYFNEYIVSDLNTVGMGEYKLIIARQDEIMVRAVYAVEGKNRH